MKWNVREEKNYTLVEFILDAPIEPKILAEIEPPAVNATKGIVVSGRGPIWLHSFLAHCYHPTAWVAHHDPRLGGAVVVQTHTPHRKIGEIIEMEE